MGKRPNFCARVWPQYRFKNFSHVFSQELTRDGSAICREHPSFIYSDVAVWKAGYNDPIRPRASKMTSRYKTVSDLGVARGPTKAYRRPLKLRLCVQALSPGKRSKAASLPSALTQSLGSSMNMRSPSMEASTPFRFHCAFHTVCLVS